MKEKISSSGDLIIRQDLWRKTPCCSCFETPCCRNLPLAPVRLDRQSDYINLLLASCYEGVFPALKESGEWTVYLGRRCSYLDKTEGKCTIHKSQSQSLVCKSYDAHNCWYINAFNRKEYRTMIPFNTDMMIWFERRYNLIERGFDKRPNWAELCKSAFDYGRNAINFTEVDPAPWASHTLPFRKSHEEQFLFFPPYKRPEHINHFELISFRLSFPGVYLAVADNCWAFLVMTGLNKSRLGLIRGEYYPAIGHKDGIYSFDSMMKEMRPFSETGEQWIIVHRANLEIIKAVTVFDSSGKVKRLPSSTEILDIIKSIKPDLAA